MKKTKQGVITVCVTLFVALFGFVAQATNWYVDAENGDDVNNDGKASDRAKKTLSVALACAKAHDTVWALPGYYTNDTQTVSGGTRLFRGVVGESVTLRSTAGAEKTFIVGAPASSPDANGLGSDAVSCLRIVRDGKVYGFTITGGRSTATSYGAGIQGDTGWSALVTDCIISNNVACRGGGVSTVDKVYRCRLIRNRATNYGTGAAVNDAMLLVNCVFDGTIWDSNTRGIVYRNGAATKIMNCTFVHGCPDCATANAFPVYNTLLLDGSAKGCSYHNCYFSKDWSTDTKSVADADCRLYTAAELALDSAYRPIKGNKVIGAGDWTTYTNLVTTAADRKLDALKGPRVMLATLDIGACEYDPTADFATALGDAAITLTNVTSGVTMAADGTPVINDGESLEVLWNFGETDCAWAVRTSVTGGGTLSVYEDGASAAGWTVTATSGTTVLGGVASGVKNLRFAFAGDGSGFLLACSDKVTVTVTDASGGLIVGGLSDGKIRIGGVLSISRNFAAAKFCRGFYVNGEYVDFNAHPDDWVWQTTVTDPFSAIAISADYPYYSEYYVDPENGDDGHDGLTPYPAHAKKSLAGALSVATAYETVWALPGVYTNETQTMNGLSYRGVVGESVTLRSTEGAEKTMVVGDASTAGLYVVKDAVVRGLTVTGCRSTGWGGGLAGDRNWNGCVFDCIVSNNVAVRGGGASNVDHLYRCRFINNQATDYGSGAAVNDARNIVSCVFDGKVWDANTRGIVYRNNSATKILNCTFVHGCPDCATAKALPVYESILLDGSQKGCSYHHCLFTKDWSTDKNSEADAATRLVTAAELQLDENFRPQKGSVAIDAGDWVTYTNQFPSVNRVAASTERALDVCGGQRVYGAAIDIGAGEYDVRPDLKRTLKTGTGMIVTMASPKVVADAVRGVSLPAAGALEATWTARFGQSSVGTCHYSVEVRGAGTLTVTVDGETLATLTAADGLKDLSFACAKDTCVMRFSYAASSDEDAGAWIGRFYGDNGLLLIVR